MSAAPTRTTPVARAGAPSVAAVPSPDAAAEWDRLAAAAAAQRGAENFPVALRILPRAARADLLRLYAYARFVDDVGDEAVVADRAALLDRVDSELRRAAAGRAGSPSPDSGPPIVAAVAGVAVLLERPGMPLRPFLDLIEANRVDQVVHSYEDFAALLGYCRLSAEPVGRVVLHVAGQADARSLALSDTICAALQVLEHCQDVREDAVAGRVYLPREDLVATGAQSVDLTAASTSPALRAAVALQVDRAAEMLRDGDELTARLHGWARPAIAGFVAGGRATVDALRAADHDVLGSAVTPTRGGTVRHALRLMAGSYL